MDTSDVICNDFDDEMMKIAVDYATISIGKGYGPFGAVIVDDKNNIVGGGHNLVSAESCDPTAHAEIVAIRDACKNLNSTLLHGCTLYTSCEPCPMCLAATYWSRIERVVYGNSKLDAKQYGFDDSFIYEELAKEMPERRFPSQYFDIILIIHNFSTFFYFHNYT